MVALGVLFASVKVTSKTVLETIARTKRYWLTDGKELFVSHGQRYPTSIWMLLSGILRTLGHL
jgi:hypothetical protein